MGDGRLAWSIVPAGALMPKVSASHGALTVVAYQGDAKTLLAFDLTTAESRPSLSRRRASPLIICGTGCNSAGRPIMRKTRTSPPDRAERAGRYHRAARHRPPRADHPRRRGAPPQRQDPARGSVSRPRDAVVSSHRPLSNFPAQVTFGNRRRIVMKRLLSLVALMAGTTANATTWHRVETIKGFEGMRSELQHLVDKYHSKAGPSHLCVVVQDTSKDRDSDSATRLLAFVYWPEASYIYTFTPTAYPPIDDTSIWGGASLNLKEDGSARRAIKAMRDVLSRRL